MPDSPCECELDLLVLPDPGGIARAAAERIVHVAREAVARRGRFALALSGGSTPQSLYRLLASPEYADSVPWSATHLFWGDERCVPPTDERSNYKLAQDAGLLARPLGGVHRMRGEIEPAVGAREYEEKLRTLFDRADDRTQGAPGGPAAFPVAVFDLVLLGLGEDGHTASLFPGSAALRETERWVVPTDAHAGIARLTLTLPVLVAARGLVFLISGAGKASSFRRILGDPDGRLPAAQVMWGAARVTVLADQAAAGVGSGPNG